MSKFSINVHGLKTLRKKATAATPMIKTGIRRNLISIGAEGKSIIRSQIPRKTGATRKSIHVRTRGTTMEFFSLSAVYTFLDKGTKPHRIPKNGKTLMAFDIGDRTVFTRKVWHPGTKALKITARSLKLIKPLSTNKMRALSKQVANSFKT
jgi:hypothetical protein